MSLEIKAITKCYGDTLALDNVSLSVEAGECVALLGPSGAGKSTLFKCVTRLEVPETGSVIALGQDMRSLAGTALRAIRREIGMIFQQFNLIGRVSAIDNVLAGRMGHAPTWRVALRCFSPADRQLALAALDRVELLERAYQRADCLSGGQQQRVAIARVMAQQARLLLADEPVASLDPQSADNVLGLLRGVARERGIAVICSLHQVELARRFADRVVALHAGRKVLDTKAGQLDNDAFEGIYAKSLADTAARSAACGTQGRITCAS
jgi:phosphonate transport system ATP-binding protein